MEANAFRSRWLDRWDMFVHSPWSQDAVESLTRSNGERLSRVEGMVDAAATREELTKKADLMQTQVSEAHVRTWLPPSFRMLTRCQRVSGRPDTVGLVFRRS